MIYDGIYKTSNIAGENKSEMLIYDSLSGECRRFMMYV